MIDDNEPFVVIFKEDIHLFNAVDWYIKTFTKIGIDMKFVQPLDSVLHSELRYSKVKTLHMWLRIREVGLISGVFQVGKFVSFAQ